MRMHSYASPERPGVEPINSVDCDCGAWVASYEANEFAPTGRDVVDWHVVDCGFWAGRVSREDIGSIA